MVTHLIYYRLFNSHFIPTGMDVLMTSHSVIEGDVLAGLRMVPEDTGVMEYKFEKVKEG